MTRRPGRPDFDKTVAFLKKNPRVRVLLVEKTERLYRNLKDYVTMDEFDIEIHFIKENFILSKESRSSEKFMYGIKVLMEKRDCEYECGYEAKRASPGRP